MYVTWFYESVDARKNYVFPSQILNINFYFVPLGINFLELIFSNKVSATTFPFLYKSLFIFMEKLDKIIKNELIHNVKFISILLSLFPNSKYYLFCSNIINRKKKKKKITQLWKIFRRFSSSTSLKLEFNVSYSLFNLKAMRFEYPIVRSINYGISHSKVSPQQSNLIPTSFESSAILLFSRFIP